MQNAHFVLHGVAPLAGYLRQVKLVRGCCNTSGQSVAAWSCQQFGRNTSRHFALQPHPERGDCADWLGHDDSILRIRSEAGVPQRVEESVACLAEALPPDLANQRNPLRRGAASLYVDVVFDDAPPPGLVASDADRPHMHEAIVPCKTWQAPPEMLLRRHRIYGECERRHFGVRRDIERI